MNKCITLSMMAIVLIAPLATAAVTVQGWYRGGETEPMALGDMWASSGDVLDAGGLDRDLLAGSLTSYPGTTAYDSQYAYRGTAWTSSTPILTDNTTELQNWGIEAWIKPDSASGSYGIIMLGRDTYGRGITIEQWNALLVCYYSGVDISSNANGVYIPVTPGTWVHMAVVNEDGENTMYANGQVVGTWSGSPDSSLYLSTDPMLYNRIGWKIGNTTPFAGQIDEVRVFTFASGAFDASDLLYDSPIAVQAWYRGGETEPKTIGDTWASGDSVLDASGLGRDMTADAATSNVGTPEYDSQSAYRGRIWTGNTPVLTENTTELQNWGIEAWIKPDTDSGGYGIIMLGRDSYGRGVTFEQWNTKLVCYFPGVDISSNTSGVFIPVTPGKWVHMAVVNEEGTNTMYANGQSVGSWAGSPDSSLYLGVDPMQYNRIGWKINNQTEFLGLVDEVRIFTFESGQFDPAYLLYTAPAGDPTTCQEVIDYGYALGADLNGDCYVEWADFGMFAAQWQECNEPGQAGCQQNW